MQTETGQFNEVMFVDPNQIIAQINLSSYNDLIASELELGTRRLPKLKAEKVQDTDLVRIFIRENNVDHAKRVLNSLVKHLKRRIDINANIEINKIEAQIKSYNIDILKIEKENIASQKKLRIIKKRIDEIEKEMGKIKMRLDSLENQQLANLKKEKRVESESLSMLLYSNEIQQSLRYHNTLNELMSSKKIDEENINLEIEQNKEEINQLRIDITILNEKKGRVGFTQLIKGPTSSGSPVSPKKKFNIIITGLSVFVLLTLFAFLLEYIKRKKSE
jgi:capsular polysaccharide biosynthesis protein